MTTHIVFMTSWSESSNAWNTPKIAMSKKMNRMGEKMGKPVLYFTHDDMNEAIELVKQFPTVYELGTISFFWETMAKLRVKLFWDYFPELY